MNASPTPRKFAILAGVSYLVIFFAAIYANFVVLEALLNDPLDTVNNHHMSVRLGILAFLLTVVFDVVVAWALYQMYKEHHLSGLSAYFRLMHAVIMGVAIYVLPEVLISDSSEQILALVNRFNIIWLIGLFFFGIHLILLGRILGKPKVIAVFLAIAGVMYMIDTIAHFVQPNYNDHADIFLAVVAVCSIVGELSFTIWLLIKGGKNVAPAKK